MSDIKGPSRSRLVLDCVGGGLPSSETLIVYEDVTSKGPVVAVGLGGEDGLETEGRWLDRPAAIALRDWLDSKDDPCMGGDVIVVTSQVAPRCIRSVCHFDQDEFVIAFEDAEYAATAANAYPKLREQNARQAERIAELEAQLQRVCEHDDYQGKRLAEIECERTRYKDVIARVEALISAKLHVADGREDSTLRELRAALRGDDTEEPCPSKS